ncbi:DENN domain-containing protein 10 [Balamuthia mandrillaris]
MDDADALFSLAGVAVLEKDKNQDLLFAWAYPLRGTIEEPELQSVILERSQLRNAELSAASFLWSKYKSTWLHSYVLPLLSEEGAATSLAPSLSGLSAFALVLLSKDYNPEKYEALSKLMAKVYAQEGSPIKLLEAYLSVFARGRAKLGDYGIFTSAEYDARKAFLVTPIKDIINLFGPESVLIWSALLMKKRIVVYSEHADLLLKIIRALPLFVWHRRDWNIIRPFVNLDSEQQMEELRASGVYIAGFTDPSIKLKQSYFDLLVDANARTVTYADHAASDFKVGSLHKEVAMYLVKAAEDPDVNNQTVIKELGMRTRDLLSKLAQLKVEDEDGSSYITLESLPNSPMSAFLYAVAGAENLTKNTAAAQ